jgi:hypothetical protein
MLAEEYVLIDISLISFSPGWTNKAEQQNIFSSSLTLLSSVPAKVTRNIGTAESPGR